MGNTPCAHAVDSVLHQRVEIKTQSGRSQTKENPPRWVQSATELNQLSSRHWLCVLFLSTKHQK